MEVSSELHLYAWCDDQMTSTSVEAEVKLIVSSVYRYWGVEEITHDFSFTRPPRILRLPDVAKRIISSQIARLHHPNPSDVVFWTDNISAFVHNAATEAFQSRCGSFTVLAEIKIFHAEEPPRWFVQRAIAASRAVAAAPFSVPWQTFQETQGVGQFLSLSPADAPAAAVPWQYFQEPQQVDQVLLLSVAEDRRLPPRRSSPVEKLEKVRYKAGVGSTATATNCVICLDDFEQGSHLSKMPCSHIFHERCLRRWLQESRACPLCRFALPTET